MVVLRPSADDAATTANPCSGQGVRIVSGPVTGVRDLDDGGTARMQATPAVDRQGIASSLYTLVVAEGGSAMTVLLIVAHQRTRTEMAGTEEIGAEVARTVVGATGLVLAVPLTTWFTVQLAPRVASGSSRHDAIANP